MENLGSKIARGATWMVTLRMFIRAIGLVSTIILARLLVPADFGVIALAMLLYSIIDLLGGFNFETAIIQSQKTERSYYDTAWTLNLIYGVFASIVLLLLAHPAAKFFNEPRIEAVIYVLAAIAFITRLENVGILEFRRELQMSKLFSLQVIRKLSSFTATVSLAIIYKSYWALVAGMVVGALVRVVSTFVAHPFRPRLSLQRTAELFGFSKWVLASSILGFLNQRSDDLVIGKILGAGPLGIYTIAYELSSLAATELVIPIAHALFPGYSKISSDRVALKWYYLRTLSVMLVIILPVTAGLVLTASELVRVLLGNKWLAAVPVIHVLAISGGLAAAFASNGSIQMALGKPRVNAILQAVRATLLVILLLLLVPGYGVMAAAWSQFIVTLGIIPAATYIVLRQLDISLLELLATIWRPVIAAAGMAVALTQAEIFLHNTKPIISLFAQVAIGAVTYGVVLYVIWRLTGRPRGAEEYLLQRARGLLGRIAPARRS